jgi:hypothetical protein
MTDVKRKIQDIKDKNILQKNSDKNIDLKKREFFKKSVLGLTGIGGIALLSKMPLVKPWTFTTSDTSEFDSISTDTINEKTAANGVVIDSVTLKDGNVVLGSGNGIDFSATADSNAGLTGENLDDYEEGVWTPTLVGSTSGNYVLDSYSEGMYVKIGNYCWFKGKLNISSDNSCTGAAIRFSLPMTAYDVGAKISDESGWPITLKNHGDAGIENPFLVLSTATSYAILTNMPDDGTVENLTPSRFDTNWEMWFSGMYRPQ